MWNRIIPQHCVSIEPFKAVLEIVKNYSWVVVDESVKNDILLKLENDWLYKPQKWQYWLWTAWHKIDEPHFYWGLYISWNKLHISNYWILLLDNWNDYKKRKEIFSSMLFSVQYPNLAKISVDPHIQLYPFRILFKYLIDFKEIDMISFSLFFYKLHTMKTEEDYNNLVKSIWEFNQLSEYVKEKQLNIESVNFIKNFVSCRYCFSLLNNFWIIKLIWEGWNRKIRSPKRSKPTNISNKVYQLDPTLVTFITDMLKKYSIYDDVKTSELKTDLARRISNYVAPELLYWGQQVFSYTNVVKKWMTLPEDLIQASKDSNRREEFENLITDAFNTFPDIDAEKIWWPSEPDVLCEYSENNILKHIFTADAKSTYKKLNWINVGRITGHKNKYWWEFAIIITPKRVPSAEIDISWSSVCLLSSYAFSEIIKLVINKQLKREDFSFKEIYEIIKTNLWNDISREIYQLIDEYSWINQKILS